MRYFFQGTSKDGNGRVICDAAISVFLAGSTTVASIYSSLTSTLAINSTTSGSATSPSPGYWSFYTDAWGYDSEQTFKIAISKSGFNPQTYDNVKGEVVLGTYTISSVKTATTHFVIPKGVLYAKSGSGSMAFNGPFEAGLYQVFSGFSPGDVTFGAGAVKEVDPQWWGAKIDDTTDDSEAWNLAFASVPITPTNQGGIKIKVPHGVSKVTSPINVPGDRTYIVEGSGNSSVIHAVGVDAFTIKEDGNTNSVFRDFAVWGDNTALKAAFNVTPTVATEVMAKVRFENLRIVNFLIAWNIPNSQLCSFHHNFVNFGVTGGSVFYMNTSGGYGESNGNRVTELQVTGLDAQVFNFTFTEGQNRASLWSLKDSDIQISGTTIPITIKDSFYLLENLEFENSTAAHLIRLVATGNSLTPLNTRLKDLYLGGGVGTINNAKIIIESTGVQIPINTTIDNCNAGSASAYLVDLNSAQHTTIINSRGLVNHSTGSRFTTILNGDQAPGQMQFHSESFGDSMGLQFKKRYGGTNTGTWRELAIMDFTANATPKVIWNETLSASTAYLIEVAMAAWNDTADTEGAGYVRKTMVYRAGAGAATLIAITGADLTAEVDAAWDLVLGVSANDVILTATGEAATMIFWFGSIKIIQMGTL